jgi:pyruvate/2-oxoglutarate dehydrogenase complex dihydrolipoamide dehydrogenase (E3) component
VPEFTHDIAVIGAGAAGLSVAAAAAQLGLDVALIERGRMGGECLHAGCVPSKALLAAAHAARDTRDATRFGLTTLLAPTDWNAVWNHVHGVIAEIAPMDSAARFRALGADIIAGEARFLDPARIAVRTASGERVLRPRRVVIATGSRPVMPPIPGLAEAGAMTHEGYFDARPAPAHLLILGGGAVGLEMADAHAGLGARVTLVTAGRVALREDPELALGLSLTLRRHGVEIIENAELVRAEPGPALILADGRRLEGTHLLVAAGKAPDLASLALDAGGIRHGPHGIATDHRLRSPTNRRVFAAGDVADPKGVGPIALTHMASEHASIILRGAVLRLPARLGAPIPRVLYTQPELAQVGLTEDQARQAGHDIRILRWPLAENDRATAERRPDGLVKLVVSRRGRLLGAGMLGPHAGETIGLLTLALGRRLGAGTLAGLVLPYPTHAEAIKRAAGSLYAGMAANPWIRRVVKLLARLPMGLLA